MKYFIIPILMIYPFFNCCHRSDPDPNEFHVRCDMNENLLKDHIIVYAQEGGRILTSHHTISGEADVNYPINNKGCIKIPTGSEKDLTIKWGKFGARVPISDLNIGFNTGPIEMKEFIGDFSLWGYCGALPKSDDQMFLKFIGDISDDIEFETVNNEKSKIILSPQKCALVDRKLGRIFSKGKLYSYIAKTEPVVFVEK